MVGRENLLMASSTTSATGLISTVIGFALFGNLIRKLALDDKLAYAFVLGSIVYMISAALMGRLSIARVAANAKLNFRQAAANLRMGLKLVFTERVVRPLVFLSATFWAMAGFGC